LDTPDNKGKGLYARRAFAVGDVVLTEKPLFSITGGLDQATMSRFNGMSEAPKEIIHNMANSHPTAESAMGGVLRTNTIPQGSDRSAATKSSLYAIICRANHSCHPNCSWRWRPDLQKEILVAQHPIAEGAEILCSYVEVWTKREERQKLISRGFNFVCDCSLCSDAELEKVVVEFRDAEENILACGRPGGDPVEAVRAVEHTIQLAKDSGLGSPMFLKSAHNDLRQVYAHMAVHGVVRHKKLYEAKVRENGVEHDRLEKICNGGGGGGGGVD
jgi:hypothetical protein